MFDILLSKYGFFDDNYTLMEKGYHGEDKMSPKQFIVMGIIFVLIVICSILLRKTKKEKLFKIYKVLAIFMPIFEIIKIAYSSYFDIIHDAGFNWGGILPFYTCSMLLYFLPFVAFGKGKVQRYSMAFFSTVGIIAGLSNFIYLSSAGFYPIFTYGCLYSIIFHSVLVFVGFSLLITGTYKPSIKTIFEGMVPVVLFSIPATIVNFIVREIPNNGFVDYMMLMDFNGFIPQITGFFKEHHIVLLFSFLMVFVGYPIATAIMVFAEMGIAKLCALFKKDKKQERTLSNDTI